MRWIKSIYRFISFEAKKSLIDCKFLLKMTSSGFRWIKSNQSEKIIFVCLHWKLSQRKWTQIQKQSPGVVLSKHSLKKVFLKISQNSQGNTCARVSFLIKLKASWGLNLPEPEVAGLSLVQVFSGEFCEIFKNTFFYRTSLVAASINFFFVDHQKVKMALLEAFLSLWFSFF